LRRGVAPNSASAQAYPHFLRAKISPKSGPRFEPASSRRSEDAIRFRRLSYWFKQRISLPAVANGDARNVNPVQMQLGPDAGRILRRNFHSLSNKPSKPDCGLGIDLMHRGFCLPTPGHARRSTSIARNSAPPSRAGETWRRKCNAPIARELRAWGRSWCDGRIAECPRLQQNRSSDDLSSCCKIVPSSVLWSSCAVCADALSAAVAVGMAVAPGAPITSPSRAMRGSPENDSG